MDFCKGNFLRTHKPHNEYRGVCRIPTTIPESCQVKSQIKRHILDIELNGKVAYKNNTSTLIWVGFSGVHFAVGEVKLHSFTV